MLPSEQCKKSKYSNLAQSHQFTPVVFKTSAAMSTGTETFLKDLGSHLKQVTGDDEAYIHFDAKVFYHHSKGK